MVANNPDGASDAGQVRTNDIFPSSDGVGTVLRTLLLVPLMLLLVLMLMILLFLLPLFFLQLLMSLFGCRYLPLFFHDKSAPLAEKLSSHSLSTDGSSESLAASQLTTDVFLCGSACSSRCLSSTWHIPYRLLTADGCALFSFLSHLFPPPLRRSLPSSIRFPRAAAGSPSSSWLQSSQPRTSTPKTSSSGRSRCVYHACVVRATSQRWVLNFVTSRTVGSPSSPVVALTARDCSYEVGLMHG